MCSYAFDIDVKKQVSWVLKGPNWGQQVEKEFLYKYAYVFARK